ncbi:hypothetical protein NQ318_007307 [Aromia moschata]|uniref:Uncharacterized protein n=1 Tax=Aromia moschata TaxID=1265417 RepID=A0AAV8Z1Z0_9CUCU|nr:hypothetical protein NQ318_007307 [Aromia moschata]
MIIRTSVSHGFLILSYSVVQICCSVVTLLPENRFWVEHEWSFLNFTWPTLGKYIAAIGSGAYVPENIVPTGLKVYNDSIYLSMPRFRSGVPVTLAYIPMDTSLKQNELLIPFPSWEMNDERFCANLQSVQSMEIDTKGIMWVLDGVRINDYYKCPPKLVLFDLNYNGLFVNSYTFSNEVCLQNGGFLKDIVIDESEGGYAYITDNSNIDPGLIVYSRTKNRAWKLRDRTMFPELWAANFMVKNQRIESLVPIDGIALSPKPTDETENRTVFYTSLTGFDLFAISSSVLKDEEFCRKDRWRSYVKFVGKSTDRQTE